MFSLKKEFVKGTLCFVRRIQTSKKCCNKDGKIRSKWKSVVGLEIHAQLATESKLFSVSGTEFAAAANSNVSLFDAAIPGTLPVLNKRCVELAVLSAMALSCKVNKVSWFDRKHYFYADLPTGYQITQQRHPVASDGVIKFCVYTPEVHKVPYSKTSRIKQVQLEQDSGKSLHDDVNRVSFIDLNRAGMPLIEIVFEPDLADGEEAAALVRELTIILQKLNCCSCKMEEGALRVDANVSIHKEGSELGVRTEIKNIGSVRGVANAIRYEIKRQESVLDAGGVVMNETRAWDAIRKETIPLRDKEEKQDYRYMPEPNLPPLRLQVSDECGGGDDALDVREWRTKIPELPEESRQKLIQQHGLSELHALTLVNQPRIHEYFSNIIMSNPSRDPKKTYNILMLELLGALYKKDLAPENCSISDLHLGDIVDLLQSETINYRTCQRAIQEVVDGSEQSPREFVKENNLEQISCTTTLEQLCRQIIDKCPKEVAAYRKGKTKVMKKLMTELGTLTNNRINGKLSIKIMTDLLTRDK